MEWGWLYVLLVRLISCLFVEEKIERVICISADYKAAISKWMSCKWLLCCPIWMKSVCKRRGSRGKERSGRRGKVQAFKDINSDLNRAPSSQAP